MASRITKADKHKLSHIGVLIDNVDKIHNGLFRIQNSDINGGRVNIMILVLLHQVVEQANQGRISQKGEGLALGVVTSYLRCLIC